MLPRSLINRVDLPLREAVRNPNPWFPLHSEVVPRVRNRVKNYFRFFFASTASAAALSSAARLARRLDSARSCLAVERRNILAGSSMLAVLAHQISPTRNMRNTGTYSLKIRTHSPRLNGGCLLWLTVPPPSSSALPPSR